MQEEKRQVSRRGFITQASVVGVAAAAATVTSLPATAAATPQRRAEPLAGVQVKGPVPEDVVVHIRDANTSEVALIAGHEEFVYHDAKLVSSVLSKFSSSRHGTGE